MRTGTSNQTCPVEACGRRLMGIATDWQEPWCIVHGESYGRRPAEGLYERERAGKERLMGPRIGGVKL